MSAQQSPIGNTPLEYLVENNNKESNIKQHLSIGMVTTSQPLIESSTSEMIPSQPQLIRNLPVFDQVSRTQQGRSRRRQRRPDQREQRQHHDNIQQHQQPRAQRFKTSFHAELDHNYWLSLGYPEYYEDNLTPVLEAYDWEKMHPKDRWDQEQLNELEKYVINDQLALIQDEIQQQQQIEALYKFQEEEEAEEKQQRDHDQLIHWEQWEQIAFLIQQFNQP